MSQISEIVGRGVELSLIESFLADTSDSRTLLLSGEAGVGKTILLDAAASEASRRGMEVLRAAGAEFDVEVSFAGLSQVLLPIHDSFDDLTSPHRSALAVVLGLGQGRAPTPLLVANAAYTLLASRAATRPVLVILDDLQWLDTASGIALAFVARRSAFANFWFLGASRSGSAFSEQAGLPEHEVSPLTEEASAELIGTQFPLLRAKALHRVLAEAQGNPLALLELAAVSPQDISVDRDAPQDVLQLSDRLQSIYADRIRAMPAAARNLLLLAALHGTGELAVLQAAAPGTTLATWAPAEQDRLVSVQEDTGRIAFRHPLVRSTIVRLAADIERRRAHHALAGALINDPERWAWHLADATLQPDKNVADALENTAHARLAKGDSVGAASALARASELSPCLSDRSRRLIHAASLRAEITGELRDASQMLGRAIASEPTLTDSLRASITTSQLLINAECDVDSAHRLLVGAIEKYPRRRDPTDETLIEALHALLIVCWMSGRAEMWTPFDAATAELSSEPPSLLTLCRSTFGDPAHDAARVLDKLDPLLSGLQHEFNPVTITRIGVASVYVDRLGECREALGRVVRDGRDGGAIALAINALLSMCNDDWLTGRWDEAEELAIEGTKLCEKHGYRRYAFMLGGFIRALVAAARGNDAIAISAAEELTDWAAATGCGIAEAFGHHLKAISSIANGDFEGAYQHASSISPAGVLAPFAPHALWVSFDLVEAAVKANRLDEAKAHVAALRENRISEISSRLALVVAGCTALAAPTEVCTSLFEEALATPGASRWPFDLARVRLAYGEHLRRVHSMTESWNQLRRALESFQALKADPWERRATNELRATGLPLPQKPMARVVTLSAQDLEIATLAASGLTNKQIAARLNLSPRTVGARLYRIFPILGITSRAALHDALRAVRAG